MSASFDDWLADHPMPTFGDWLERIRTFRRGCETDVGLLAVLRSEGMVVSDTTLGHWKANRRGPDAHRLMQLFQIFIVGETERRFVALMVTKMRSQRMKAGAA